MTDLERTLTFVLQREGGYVWDKNDPGGETNFGISKRAYPNEDIKNLTVERAKEIYELDYWHPVGCAAMSWPLNLIACDTAVNMGVGRARKFLALTNDPEAYLQLRLARYEQIVKDRPASAKFLAGWRKRVALLRKAAGLS